MNGPIFHLPRFFRFASRRVTSALGTWTNRRAKASNALNPLGFLLFAFMVNPFGLCENCIRFWRIAATPQSAKLTRLRPTVRLYVLENQLDANVIERHGLFSLMNDTTQGSVTSIVQFSVVGKPTDHVIQPIQSQLEPSNRRIIRFFKLMQSQLEAINLGLPLHFPWIGTTRFFLGEKTTHCEGSLFDPHESGIVDSGQLPVCQCLTLPSP